MSARVQRQPRNRTGARLNPRGALHRQAMTQRSVAAQQGLSFQTHRIPGPHIRITKGVQDLVDEVKQRDPHQPEFHQAVEEVLDTAMPVFEKHPEYLPIMRRLVEPERVIMFRVPWVDDQGNTQVNRGYRVQFSSALGPYKGGLRFHPTVNLSIIKFLGFEQILKNALTTLPMGGGKGGSDFNPKGRSDGELMRFCQAFMTELARHIGPDTDVPAGDIGVDGKVIGYLFGQYKKLRNDFTGVLTGKSFDFGGSRLRPEATGYGLVYFAQNVIEGRLGGGAKGLEGKRVAVSGSGNVAQFAVEKLLQLGAVPVSLSDSGGAIVEPEGLSLQHLHQVMQLKGCGGRLSDYKPSDSGKYIEGGKPWAHVGKYDIAMPCATQNEVGLEDAKAIVGAGAQLLCEGANMPCTNEAIEHLHENKVEFGPAKAANAGGVAVSGLEMSQNSQRLAWSSEDVDEKLHSIMRSVYESADSTAKEYGVSLQAGANIAGFLKVARAMQAQGVV